MLNDLEGDGGSRERAGRMEQLEHCKRSSQRQGGMKAECCSLMHLLVQGDNQKQKQNEEQKNANTGNRNHYQFIDNFKTNF